MQQAGRKERGGRPAPVSCQHLRKEEHQDEYDRAAESAQKRAQDRRRRDEYKGGAHIPPGHFDGRRSEQIAQAQKLQNGIENGRDPGRIYIDFLRVPVDQIAVYQSRFPYARALRKRMDRNTDVYRAFPGSGPVGSGAYLSSARIASVTS